MPRRKRKKRRTPKKSLSGKRGTPFNPALGTLKALKRKDHTPSTPETQKREEPVPGADRGEDDFFREAMSGVTPLPGDKSRIARDPDITTRPAHPPNTADLEAMAHLSDLVSGTAEMDIRFSDEYIEGCVKGFDRKLMRRLKNGDFPIQDHVDLHGLKKDEAESLVRDFLLRSYRSGYRCVLMVHGRGLNSENHIPVLKRRIPVWLSRGPVRKIILAFSTARTYDGGTGAVYVLLKRSRGRV